MESSKEEEATEPDKPEIEHMPEFDKCMHHLRKFKTIGEDLERFEKALLANYPDLEPWGLNVCVVQGVSGIEYEKAYIAKKFKCVYLNSFQLIRLTYTCDPGNNKIIFIEIYFKGDKEIEDKELIKKYLVKKRVQQVAG
jgi:hypothetical protein